MVKKRIKGRKSKNNTGRKEKEEEYTKRKGNERKAT